MHSVITYLLKTEDASIVFTKHVCSFPLVNRILMFLFIPIFIELSVFIDKPTSLNLQVIQLEHRNRLIISFVASLLFYNVCILRCDTVISIFIS